ncbi:MAG: RNA methyltransferase [Acidobacteriota bacterium]|nr:RNA methyltransferase [Acidobacteriota bacterium]
MVGLEGPHLVEEALRAGLGVKCIVVGESMQNWVQGLKLPHETELLVAPNDIIVSLLSTEAPQPVAALVEQPKWSWEEALGQRDRAALVIVLAELQDPGNVGTILRSAEAFGATGVVSLPGTVNEWNAKTVRASAGSVLRMPVVSASVEECFARLHDAGVTVMTTAVDGALNAARSDLRKPVALILGNEGAGVPREIAGKADGAVTIDCPGPVESLNAAVAASVLLYEAARQRSAKR